MIMLKQCAVLATTTAAQGDRDAGVRWNARKVYLKLRVGAPGMRVQMGIHGWYGNVTPLDRRGKQGCSSADKSFLPETSAE
ncbi:hypothetical protein F1880_001948 [Penicillium rolfsii]|nr:hypothetical protein F1880_001948 [Penicillium rolfsii]